MKIIVILMVASLACVSVGQVCSRVFINILYIFPVLFAWSSQLGLPVIHKLSLKKSSAIWSIHYSYVDTVAYRHLHKAHFPKQITLLTFRTDWCLSNNKAPSSKPYNSPNSRRASRSLSAISLIHAFKVLKH